MVEKNRQKISCVETSVNQNRVVRFLKILFGKCVVRIVFEFWVFELCKCKASWNDNSCENRRILDVSKINRSINRQNSNQNSDLYCTHVRLPRSHDARTFQVIDIANYHPSFERSGSKLGGGNRPHALRPRFSRASSTRELRCRDRTRTDGTICYYLRAATGRTASEIYRDYNTVFSTGFAGTRRAGKGEPLVGNRLESSTGAVARSAGATVFRRKTS